MYTGLYYPHTSLRDSETLKSALLLWDNLEFIVPSSDHSIRSPDNNKLVDEALDLIGVARVPTYKEQKVAHDIIEDLVTSDLPSQFFLDSSPVHDRYLVYPDKLLDMTWQMLRKTNLVKDPDIKHFNDWSMSQDIGLSIMSILADSCAGNTRRLVTDRVNAYQQLSESLIHLESGTYGTDSIDTSRIVLTTLKLVDPQQFTLSELIELRKREHSQADGTLTELRHSYLDRIDQCTKQLANCTTDADIEEIHRTFEQSARKDLIDLISELKGRSLDVLISKEVGVSFLAAIGMAVSPWTLPSGMLAVGSLTQQLRRFKADRRKIMSSHAMSWVFELSQQNKPIKPY